MQSVLNYVAPPLAIQRMCREEVCPRCRNISVLHGGVKVIHIAVCAPCVQNTTSPQCAAGSDFGSAGGDAERQTEDISE
jgi:hypothetical protein